MSEYIFYVHAVFWLCAEKLLDEVFCVWADVLLEGYISLKILTTTTNLLSYHQNIIKCCTLALGLKRRLSSNKFVAKYPQAPNIDSLVVFVTFYHLWRNVIWCSTKGLTKKVRGVNRPAEVADFDCALRENHKVYNNTLQTS